MPSSDLGPRMAGVMVSLHPTDIPGKVNIELTDVGPEPLTLDVTVNVLRMALALAELGLKSGYAGEGQAERDDDGRVVGE